VPFPTAYLPVRQLAIINEHVYHPCRPLLQSSGIIMALTHLPNELLVKIISHVLPEGFESAALTCRRVHAICLPFVERHNRLRSQFHDFDYREIKSDPSFTIRTTFDLIVRIAIEPIVARYVRNAHFRVDECFTSGRPREFNPDYSCGDAVPKLLAASPYLVEAGLDWQEYYNEIEKDLQASRYSQNAAAFLLTLLPNVKTLSLPHRWNPDPTTVKLIDVIVRKAKESHHHPFDTPSLAQTTEFSMKLHKRYDLGAASPFLALPRIQTFYAPICVTNNNVSHRSICPSIDRYGGFARTLRSVHLMYCSIDHVGIAELLNQTPNLRTLVYSHTTSSIDGFRYHKWDICKFVTAIERVAGSHLVELLVSIYTLRGSVAPGKASMRNFQRLQRLEFPLEIASCNMVAAATSVEGLQINQEVDLPEPFIFGDLVPASVSQLSLLSRGTNGHVEALERLFRGFVANKESQLPALGEIYLSCPVGADDAYKEQGANLVAYTKKVGVIMQLELRSSYDGVTWDEIPLP